MSSNAHRILWFLLVSFLLVNAWQGGAQTVVLMKGTGIQPTTVAKGTTLGPPVVIQVPVGAFVVLEESWPSDQPAYPCQSWVIVSGNSYPVKTMKTAGSCPVTVRGDELARARRGEVFVAKAVFYGDPSYDAIAPDIVQRSRALSAQLRGDFREALQASGSPAAVQPPSSLGTRAMGPLMGNQGFMGGTDFRDVQVPSAVECSSLCAIENACVAMTYIVSTKKCYLKHALTQLVPTGDMVSAVKKK